MASMEAYNKFEEYACSIIEQMERNNKEFEEIRVRMIQFQNESFRNMEESKRLVENNRQLAELLISYR